MSIGPVGVDGVAFGAGVAGGVGWEFAVGEGIDGGFGSVAAGVAVTVSVMATMVRICAKRRGMGESTFAVGGRGGGWRVTVKLRRCP
ncbi:hypothetical protein GCM10020220_013790 [Nonomuraea rubra]